MGAGLGLRGDTLRLGLLPPLRGGRLAWPTPRAWDNPNPALPPYDVKTPHTWSPAYGGYTGRRASLPGGYLRRVSGRKGGPKSEEASIWINFDQNAGPATHRDLLKK